MRHGLSLCGPARSVPPPPGTSPNRNDSPPVVRNLPVLPEIYSLPGAEAQLAGDDGNRERILCQDGSDVRRHVVGAFGVVLVGRIAVWDETGEKRLQVTAYTGIGVF